MPSDESKGNQLDAIGSLAQRQLDNTVVELAPSDPAPLNDLLDRKLGLGGDCVHEVDNLVTTVMGNPGTTQASPSFFLSVSYSSVTSAMI